MNGEGRETPWLDYGEEIYEEHLAAVRKAARRAWWRRLGRRAACLVGVFAAIYLAGLALLAARSDVVRLGDRPATCSPARG